MLMDVLCFIGVVQFGPELDCRIEHMAKAAYGVKTTFFVNYYVHDPAFKHRWNLNLTHFLHSDRARNISVKRIKLKDHCPACSCEASASCSDNYMTEEDKVNGRMDVYMCHLEDTDRGTIKDVPAIAKITKWALGSYIFLTVLLGWMSACASCPASLPWLVFGTLSFLVFLIAGVMSFIMWCFISLICLGVCKLQDGEFEREHGRPPPRWEELAPARSRYIKCAFALNALHGCLIYLMTEGADFEASFGVQVFNDVVLSLDSFLLKGPEALAEYLGADLSKLMPWIPTCFYDMYEPTDWGILQQIEDGVAMVKSAPPEINSSSPDSKGDSKPDSKGDSKGDSKTGVRQERQARVKTAE